MTLKEYLIKENQKMLSENQYERIALLFAFASGFDPDAKVIDVCAIIKDIT